MKKPELADGLEQYTGERLRGGERALSLMRRAEQKQILRLFFAWAAPASGRDALGSSERRTIDWLFATDGLVSIPGKYEVAVEAVLMPADTYAARNGFDMTRANRYWRRVAKEVGQYISPVVMPASVIETQPGMQEYMATRAYALEKLDRKTREKICQAACKYTAADKKSAYEAAGEYAMFRAAEADYVDNDLNALWVSLNVPERDSMCAPGPRLYVPESVRTPWLQEDA